MNMNFQAILFTVALLATEANSATHEYADYWMKAGKKQLLEILKHQQDYQKAKNIIIFVGDGMGVATITSARIYKGQKKGETGETGFLSFEKFSTIGLSKTYAVDKQVTDSAASATALFTGVKTNYMILGLDARAKYNVCDSPTYNKSSVSSIMTWAQDSSKDTGFVTTTRVTHATPAGLYAHTNSRHWECDSKIPHVYRTCVKDIALQLVTDDPGRKFKVIMGGGANQLGLQSLNGSIYDGCNRTDGINLAQKWIKNKRNSMLITTKKELKDVDVVKTEYLLGLFGPDHMSYAGDQNKPDQPSLADMTTQAIKILLKNPNGFVLMVEGGRIDHAHHENYAQLALEETLEFEEAIAAAVSMTDEKQTLIIVTADHSHSLTINGYPDRGNDILGISDNENATYETLTYANGPGYTYHRLYSSDSQKIWRNLKNSSLERNGTFYRHFSPIYLSSETHGGEDVPVYAHGPSSNLFSGVYDHNYIAHAISHAACIGPHATICNERGGAATVFLSYSVHILTLFIHSSILAFKII
jgi:alkaline phosphatase